MAKRHPTTHNPLNHSLSTLAMLDMHSRGGKVENGKIYSFTGNRLNPFLSGDGYPTVSIHYASRRIKVFVHRLAAYQKFGDALFAPGIEVRHLNSDKLDFSESNIAIGTHSENMMDMPTDLRISRAKNAAKANWKHKAPRSTVFKALSTGKSYAEINELYGISKSTLSYMKNHSDQYQEWIAEQAA